MITWQLLLTAVVVVTVVFAGLALVKLFLNVVIMILRIIQSLKYAWTQDEYEDRLFAFLMMYERLENANKQEG